MPVISAIFISFTVFAYQYANPGLRFFIIAGNIIHLDGVGGVWTILKDNKVFLS